MNHLPHQFPGLLPGKYRITSPASYRYNCIAWAAEDCMRWWEPKMLGYWPGTALRDYTIGGYVSAFQTLGYSIALDGNFEPGFEKVALFVNDQGLPTHAARQLHSGKWTSKLGQQEDIEHDDVHALEGLRYGNIHCFLKHPISNPAPIQGVSSITQGDPST